MKYHNLIEMAGFLFFMISLSSFAQSQPLSKGSTAPAFSAEASRGGKEFHFSMKNALAKGPVVVYFFPSAYTGGCDLEAHTFATMIDQFKAAGTTVIGVSADDIKRLNSFSADPDYCAGAFPVASGPDGKIAAEYGLKMAPVRVGAKDVRGVEINHGFIGSAIEVKMSGLIGSKNYASPIGLCSAVILKKCVSESPSLMIEHAPFAIPGK